MTVAQDKAGRTQSGKRLRSCALWLTLALQPRAVWGKPELTSRIEPRAPGAFGGEGVAGNSSSSSPAVLFSPAWEAQYASGDVGCHMGRKRYVWRPCGFGSNIIHLLNALVYGLAVKKWSDVAVISPAGQLEALKCRGDGSRQLSGYECLFRPMPHVCTFSSIQGWKDYMGAHNVSQKEIHEATTLGWQFLRLHQRDQQSKALQEYGVDTFGALAVMARYMWNNLAPWLEEDVRKETERPALSVFRDSPFVGFHIRRGDKISEGEMKMVETKEYLSAAADYLNDEKAEGRTPADEIKAIWVASDDRNAVNEVRALAPKYFPNVSKDKIMWISGGGNGGVVTTRSELESYAGFVFVFVDLQVLANADVFVGTYTSNVSRMVALLREALAGKRRDSSISLDKTNFGLNYRA